MEYFINPPPSGRHREAGDDGQPTWAHIPQMTREAVVAAAESRRQNLLAEATVIIAPLQDAAELEIATDDELKRYAEWRKYRVRLSRVDVSSAPDIAWPAAPEA